MRTTVVARAVPLLLISSVICAPSALAIPLTPDTFEDGTTMGWFVPDVPPIPPTNIPDGGPAGAGDGYLQLHATGALGPGSRLSVLNDAQWMGDYLAAGISAITMDVNNFGPNEVVLRLLFENFATVPGPPTNLAVTLADIVVPAGSGWTPVVFDLSAVNLAALLGTVNGALSDVTTLRLFHNPNPAHPGPMVGPPPVAVTLGVDNITAVRALPEPFSAVLFMGGLAACLARRRTSRHVIVATSARAAA